MPTYWGVKQASPRPPKKQPQQQQQQRQRSTCQRTRGTKYQTKQFHNPNLGEVENIPWFFIGR